MSNEGAYLFGGHRLRRLKSVVFAPPWALTSILIEHSKGGTLTLLALANRRRLSVRQSTDRDDATIGDLGLWCRACWPPSGDAGLAGLAGHDPGGVRRRLPEPVR